MRQDEAPSRSVGEVVARWRRGPRTAPHFVDVRELPARPAVTAPLPADLDGRLVAALAARGVTRLYSHQREAVEALGAGADVVVATPTASGKSLCYHVPVLQALLTDPTARALYLFPTKALARDQVESVRALAEACGARDLGVAVYDGDTPPDARRAARDRARIVATNPDMLHAGILPHHAAWAGFLAGLRVVVVDELHVYRGVFGAGVANVLRRLRRIAAFHGAAPRFVATSATIANPGELAARVLGSDPARLRVLTESGAPAGPRTFLLYNPPVLDAALGLRASYLKSAERLTRDLLAAGIPTLVFGRSRRAVELLVRYLRDDLDERGVDDVDEVVRGYRGGYLPDRRREVERRLRDGDASCVVATSALELGIDVGGLDAVVIAGWPGSRAATWQRAGRAGRRSAPSVVVLVASSEPLDQYVAADPEFLHGEPPEHGRVDPDNLAVLVPHLKCAAFELPFADGETFGALAADETREVLRHLAARGLVHEDPEGGGFHWVADAYPAQGVSLRGFVEENFTVVSLAPAEGRAPERLGGPADAPAGQILAEVDHRDAARYLHPGAIYSLEGRLHEVMRLDWAARKAFVRAVDADYTTEALTQVRVEPLERLAEDAAGGAACGEVHVVEKVVGFKKIRLRTHENVGYGDVSLPEAQLHTRALWLDPRLPAAAAADRGAPRASWLDGVARAAVALQHAAALVVLADARDVERAVDVRPDRRPGGAAALPRIYLYDAMPGGSGLTERLFDERAILVARALRLVRACPCRAGCPTCVGPAGEAPGDGKRAAAEILADLAARLAGDSRPAAEAPWEAPAEAPSKAPAEAPSKAPAEAPWEAPAEARR